MGVWELLCLGGTKSTENGYPNSIRELLLLASLISDQIKQRLRQGSTSLADLASLSSTFSFVGYSQNMRIQIGSDEDLRRYFKACMTPCKVFVGIVGTEASLEGNEDAKFQLVDVEHFVATCEHSKCQESVKFNVGGHLREAHHATVERIPLLGAMLRFPRNSGQPIFVDMSPAAFDVLLELARGRSTRYLESLEPSLKVLVQETAEYAGLPFATQDSFSFKLMAAMPTNRSVVNGFAYISQGDTSFTTGVRPQWNTVVGDVQVPQTCAAYWEVEVVRLGCQAKDFIVGVVNTSFSQVHSALDSTNQGWGLFHGGNGTFLRMNNQNTGSNYSTTFPIDTGTRIGILVDISKGGLMFFHDGVFKLSHTANTKGQLLLPALSIYSDTELAVKTGLRVPM